MECAHHFVKLNSTVFDESPFVMYPILFLEIVLIIAYCILWPFLCVAVTRADDSVMYVCDLIKVTVLGYYCSLMGSFAAERYIATHFWKWYEKGSAFTLLVLLATESVMIIPNFIEAVLNLNGTVSIESNFFILAAAFVLSSAAFLRTYCLNVRIHRNLSLGAQLGYSVSRTFQVRENVTVMKYMFDIMVPLAPFPLAAFAAFSIKMFGTSDWQFTRDVSYALYDLFIAAFCSSHLLRAIYCNKTIYREFTRIGIVRAFKSRRIDSELKLSVSMFSEIGTASVTESYFSQLSDSWNK